MSSLRQTLKDAGWRQGVILAPGPFAHPSAFAYLVLNQTCDCINPDFEKEPHLELLPLERVAKKPDTRLKNGKNPRQIHFQIQENGSDIWVNAKVTEIFQFDRSEHVSLVFAGCFSISRATLDGLITWRAQRYLRPAFPDAFETAFSTLTGTFGHIIAKQEAIIDSLLIAISPFEEIKEGDYYGIQLHLMVEPSVMGKPEILEALKQSATEIEELMATCAAFDSPKCVVTSLDEMTLWKARRLLDFSRYDYLSFGKEEDNPEH